MFSFSSPAAECESGEYTEMAGDSEAGYETDEYEFLDEEEADRVVTEKGDYLAGSSCSAGRTSARSSPRARPRWPLRR